jgi:hypothetical protein
VIIHASKKEEACRKESKDKKKHIKNKTNVKTLNFDMSRPAFTILAAA